MCGIAGLIHRGKSSNVGSELQANVASIKAQRSRFNWIRLIC